MSMNSTTLIADIKERMHEELGIDFTGSESPSAMEIMIEEILKHLAANIEVDTSLINGGLNSVFIGGVPAPSDGGTALQVAWIASTSAGAKDKAKGTVR